MPARPAPAEPPALHFHRLPFPVVPSVPPALWHCEPGPAFTGAARPQQVIEFSGQGLGCSAGSETAEGRQTELSCWLLPRLLTRWQAAVWTNAGCTGPGC